MADDIKATKHTFSTSSSEEIATLRANSGKKIVLKRILTDSVATVTLYVSLDDVTHDADGYPASVLNLSPNRDIYLEAKDNIKITAIDTSASATVKVWLLFDKDVD